MKLCTRREGAEVVAITTNRSPMSNPLAGGVAFASACGVEPHAGPGTQIKYRYNRDQLYFNDDRNRRIKSISTTCIGDQSHS